jgi:hypothetical protein
LKIHGLPITSRCWLVFSLQWSYTANVVGTCFLNWLEFAQILNSSVLLWFAKAVILLKIYWLFIPTVSCFAYFIFYQYEAQLFKSLILSLILVLTRIFVDWVPLSAFSTDFSIRNHIPKINFTNATLFHLNLKAQ